MSDGSDVTAPGPPVGRRLSSRARRLRRPAAGNMASALEQFVNSVRQLSAQGEAMGAGREPASGLRLGSWHLGRGRGAREMGDPFAQAPASAPRRRSSVRLASQRPFPTWPRCRAPRGWQRSTPGGPGSRLPLGGAELWPL